MWYLNRHFYEQMKVYFPDLSHRLWYWVIGQKYFNLIFFWNHKNSTSICILHWRFEGHRTHEKNRNYLSNWKNLASQLSLSLNVIKNAERKKCLKRHILKHHSMSSVLFSCFFLPFCWFDSLFSLCSLESIVVTICFLFVLFKSVNRYTINYYDRTQYTQKWMKIPENTKKKSFVTPEWEKHSIGYGTTYITDTTDMWTLFLFLVDSTLLQCFKRR